MTIVFPRILPILWILSALLVIGFTLGFVWFRLTQPAFGQRAFVERAQAIVVFTGSQARIPSGLALWRKGAAPRLLVSGVYRKTTSRDLIGEEAAGSVALGRAARNTFENAVETVLWTNKNDIDKIILVTSDVHMRRSRLYLRCLAPNLEVVPFAVRFRHQNLWRSNIKEYAKYLLALAHCRIAVLPDYFPTPQARAQEDGRNAADRKIGKKS